MATTATTEAATQTPSDPLETMDRERLLVAARMYRLLCEQRLREMQRLEQQRDYWKRIALP